MSDLISRSALIDELDNYEKELREDREIAIETDDEQMLFAIMNQETAICRIIRNVMNAPTAYDVDKVLERLEDHKQKYVAIYEKGEYKDSHFFKGKIDAFDVAKNIVRAGGKDTNVPTKEHWKDAMMNTFLGGKR